MKVNTPPSKFNPLMFDKIKVGDTLIATKNLFMGLNGSLAFKKGNKYIISNIEFNIVIVKSEYSENHGLNNNEDGWLSEFLIIT